MLFLKRKAPLKISLPPFLPSLHSSSVTYLHTRLYTTLSYSLFLVSNSACTHIVYTTCTQRLHHPHFNIRHTSIWSCVQTSPSVMHLVFVHHFLVTLASKKKKMKKKQRSLMTWSFSSDLLDKKQELCCVTSLNMRAFGEGVQETGVMSLNMRESIW